MSLFGGVISVQGIAFLIFSIMAVAAVGYILGRFKIKGISLGTSGVFIMALVFGALFYDELAASLKSAELTQNALKIVENIGLVLFVSAVGFMAGPKFFKNLQKNYKSYLVIGICIPLTGGIIASAMYLLFRHTAADQHEFLALIDGILSGALTTTPGFAAAKETVSNFYAATPELAAEYESVVTVGHGIAYLFGVVGIVLFVQLVPKLTRADMEAERQKLMNADVEARKPYQGKLIRIDKLGIGAFVLAAVLGLILGNIRIPLTSRGLSGTCFSLTAAGGALITALLFGHFGRIGKIDITPNKETLSCFRELGLVLFLVGAGIAGGANFVKYFKPVYFLYGAVMTIISLIVGYALNSFLHFLFGHVASVLFALHAPCDLGMHFGIDEDLERMIAMKYFIGISPDDNAVFTLLCNIENDSALCNEKTGQIGLRFGKACKGIAVGYRKIPE